MGNIKKKNCDMAFIAHKFLCFCIHICNAHSCFIHLNKLFKCAGFFVYMCIICMFTHTHTCRLQAAGEDNATDFLCCPLLINDSLKVESHISLIPSRRAQAQILSSSLCFGLCRCDRLRDGRYGERGGINTIRGL